MKKRRNPITHKKNNIGTVLTHLTLSLALCFANFVHAAPIGGNVTAGSADISATDNTTTIHQTTSNAVINWHGFSVGTTESVNFVQLNTDSVTLNRVTGSNPSNIHGAVSANGRIFLINPNGVLLGPSSQVNVGGFVASTLEISDADFMLGDYTFAGDSTAAVINKGSISTNADGGHVALLGARVSNEGLINAKLGTVALAAGSKVTLDVAGDNLLKVTVDEGAVDALVNNGGMIKADGGQVLMTARGAGRLLTNAVNNTGVVRAQSIDSQNGKIFLSAGPEAGVTTVSGTLDASGAAPNQTGGKIQVLGHTVQLENARLDASGDSGGGKVAVGGNVKGAGPLPNSVITSVDQDTVVNANATRAGDGGVISVWSDSTTAFAGTLTARGGELAGDGGFVETSGNYLTLSDTAYVDALAPSGKTGMWLLDPIDWIIAAAGGDETPGQVAVSLATADRIIEVSRDITVRDAITWSTSQNLTLDAGNNIIVNGVITASTAGAQLKLVSGNDVQISSVITASGATNQINITAANNITSTAAMTASSAATQIKLTAGQDINVGTVTADAGGSITLRANRNIVINTASADTGTVSLIADSDGTGPGVANGTVTVVSKVWALNTLIRFNPDSYAATNAEVISYDTKSTGTKDIKAWAFTKANNKTYDATTTSTLSFNGDVVNAGDVTLELGSANFDTKDVGAEKLVTYLGYSLGGTSNNLALYASSGNTTANITPATLAVTAAGIDRVYDATTTATVNLNATALASDTVVLSNTAANFQDKNVGNSKIVDVTGISLSGTDAGNYVTSTTAATTANITPASLAVTAAGISRVYDATTTATVNLNATALASDTVVLSNTAASFQDKNVANSKVVDVTGITLSGTDAGNYVTSTTAATTANITQATLAVTAAGIDRVYDATTVASVNLGATALASDTVVLSSTAASFLDKNVADSKTVNVSGITLSGTDAGNYVASTTAATTANITPASLAVTAAGISRVYDATTTATVNLNATALASDTVVLSNTAASFLDKNVADGKTINVSGITLSGTDAGNYVTNTTAATTANITPASLAVTASGIDRVYDATTVASVTLSATALASDTVVLGNTAASFQDKNVANNKTVNVSGITLSGTDAGNYVANTTAATTANITPASLAVTASGISRVYDATTTANVNLNATALASDTVVLGNTAASFLDKNVADGKTVNVSGISLSGLDAGNYVANVSTDTTANITPASLAVTASGIDRIYDATTTATVNLNATALASDTVVLGNTAAGFQDKNVADGKTVNVSGITLTGTDAGNYVANVSTDTTANITPATLAVTASGVDRVYDATTTATVTLLDNRIAGDSFLTGYSAASFDTAEVGQDKPISVTGISAVGSDAKNYFSNTTTTTSASITASPDVVIPDVVVPDVAVPDIAVPDVAVPDVAVPDVAVPDVAVPDVAVPDVAVPDVVPDVAVPDVVVPEVLPQEALTVEVLTAVESVLEAPVIPLTTNSPFQTTSPQNQQLGGIAASPIDFAGTTETGSSATPASESDAE